TTVVERRVSCYPETLFVSIHPPAELGANYAFLDGDSHSGPLRVAVYPEFLSSTILTMTKFKGGVQTRTTSFFAQFSTPVDSFTVSDWAQCDSILLVYQVNQSNGAENSFAFSAKRPLASTPPAPWVLVLDRDACRQPFDTVQDDYTIRDGEEQPFTDALRQLGVTVQVENGLPADLSNCRGIFLVGGYDTQTGAITIDDAMLTRLNAFMDNGGDIYVEGSRLGQYMDPLQGAGTPLQQSFWSRFSCTFTPGNSFGNLLQWSTSGNAFIPTHQFSYDNAGSPNTYNGVLTPTGNGAYLARDGGLKIRTTAVRAVSGSSTRIMSTILLGGATGLSGDTRESFINDILTLFDTNLAALAVSRATVNVELRHVSISGVLENYENEPISLARIDKSGSHDVSVQVTRVGGEWHFNARDDLETASAHYQLTDVANERVLWQQTVSERMPDYTLRVTGVYPNPVRDAARVAVDSPAATRATLAVYDVAGRMVSSEKTSLQRGSNLLFLHAVPAVSGVYFVHIAVPGAEARGRLLVIR
ncbi:MAG TPA: T9SS type A sorting domain-containing protein, partial [Candidatus Krumholzibacteria bacterium]|nr:T9SS type A sorting domain-containing protein [Candidatus Krumholzibacteria bacterium]